MENNKVYRYKKLFKLTPKLFGGLADNRRKSLVFQLINHLKVGNYQRVNNEVLKLLNLLEVEDGDKREFLKYWKDVYFSGNSTDFEGSAYAFVMGLLNIKSSS